MDYREVSKKIIDKHLQQTALRMAVHCVRNTVIEDYHAAGKLSDKEMKEFNQEGTNKIYSFYRFS